MYRLGEGEPRGPQTPAVRLCPQAVTHLASGFGQQVAQRNSKLKIDELQSVARKIRARTISNSHLTQTPHLGSSLSCVDILVAAYFHGLRIDPRYPTD